MKTKTEENGITSVKNYKNSFSKLKLINSSTIKPGASWEVTRISLSIFFLLSENIDIFSHPSWRKTLKKFPIEFWSIPLHLKHMATHFPYKFQYILTNNWESKIYDKNGNWNISISFFEIYLTDYCGVQAHCINLWMDQIHWKFYVEFIGTCSMIFHFEYFYVLRQPGCHKKYHVLAKQST